ATNTGNEYKTLYLPEHLGEAAYNAMKEEPVVLEMMDLYEKTSIVIHGIGSADEMATRRKMIASDRVDLENLGAVGEAFGYYFDEEGKAVQRIRTVGLQLEQVKNCPTILAVAGGAKKAKAILSYFKNAAKQTIFITDMAA
ncbi:MAG: sugar-binding domain-containing protein, partial [Kurthia sp.]